jgi:hypothetical protein
MNRTTLNKTTRSGTQSQVYFDDQSLRRDPSEPPAIHSFIRSHPHHFRRASDVSGKSLPTPSSQPLPKPVFIPKIYQMMLQPEAPRRRTHLNDNALKQRETASRSHQQHVQYCTTRHNTIANTTDIPSSQEDAAMSTLARFRLIRLKENHIDSANPPIHVTRLPTDPLVFKNIAAFEHSQRRRCSDLIRASAINLETATKHLDTESTEDAFPLQRENTDALPDISNTPAKRAGTAAGLRSKPAAKRSFLKKTQTSTAAAARNRLAPRDILQHQLEGPIEPWAVNENDFGPYPSMAHLL